MTLNVNKLNCLGYPGLHDNPWLCDCQISMLMSLSMTLGSTVVLMDQLLMCSKSLSQSELLQTQAELSRCMRPSVQPAATRVISPMGSNVILRCDATGYPTPTLTWIKTSTYTSKLARVSSNVTNIWELVESCCDLFFCTDCCQQDNLDNSEQLPRILESCKCRCFVASNKHFYFIQWFRLSYYLKYCICICVHNGEGI